MPGPLRLPFNRSTPLLDDRGMPIAPPRPADCARCHAAAPTPELKALARRLSLLIQNRGRSVAVGAGFFVAFVGAFVIIRALLPSSLLRIAMLLAVSVSLVALSRLFLARSARLALTSTAVAGGLCGSCVSSLEGLPVNDDGCVQCPECGAAWRAERITAPHWSSNTPRWPHPNHWAVLIPGVRASSSLWTTDDRSRYVPVPDSRLIRVPPSRLARVAPDRLRAARRASRNSGRLGRLVVLAALAFAPILLAAMLRSPGEPYFNQTLGMSALALSALLVLIGIAIQFSSLWCPPAATARALVAHGLCGSCLAELDAPPDSDGCIPCARCGAAWKPTPLPATTTIPA